jgi:undecaprenyl-diphosphatase
MPISSTAHMRIVPTLFGWQDPGSAFSAAMQLAALAAVISYFWRDVSDLLFGSLSAIGRRDFSDRSLKLAFGIAIGTIPIGIAGLALPSCSTPAPPRSAASKSSVSLASSWRYCSALPS